MTNNLMSLKEIAYGDGALRTLSLETVDALLTRCDNERALAEAAKKAILAELQRRFGDSINAAYLREAKDTGAVHVQADGYDLLCERPKRVEWDQDALAKVGDEISAAGDDPHEYLSVSYKVDERKFTAWPSYLREKFAAARTVKPGAMTIKLAKLEQV